MTPVFRHNRAIHATSLRNRIFLACTLLATASLGGVFAYVYARASREAETELQRGVTEASMLLEQNRAELTATFTRLARLVADLPKLKAAVATGDAPTVQPLADEYRTEMSADLLILTTSNGTIVGSAGPHPLILPPAIKAAAPMDDVSTYAEHPHGVAQIVSVPILIEDDVPYLLGRLTVGFFLDGTIAAQLKRLTGSEIAFGLHDSIVASTLPESARAQLAPLLKQTDLLTASIGGEDFIGLARPLRIAGAATTVTPVALVLRSRTERLRFLDTMRNALIGGLVVTLALATLVSYAVARTVTRPLSAITSAMRDVAETGDLSRKVSLRSGRWDDADARVLASTFNTLTDSVARFQSEAAQKERLLSLGRLSTVIAHEVRNPLMIIKTALRSLRRDGIPDTERTEAINDIEDETTRLNRIVADVLDFAKPIPFRIAEADLNAICRDSAQAAFADSEAQGPALDLDASLPPVALDAERFRTALINVLANARHATQATPFTPAVWLKTRATERSALVTVNDCGSGINPDDMPHIFDPYFTTRRAGTGLGLPITKNIIEGMGGTISVSSRQGKGTEIRIEFPLAAGEVRS